jgi:hypothetical protein
VPKQGEIIVYDSDGSAIKEPRIKIGNGVSNVKSLPFSALSKEEIETKISEGFGTYYVSVGKKTDSTLGLKATAEGSYTTASGNYSHAEGSYTIASGAHSHAEGAPVNVNQVPTYFTTAQGAGSHAEGRAT